MQATPAVLGPPLLNGSFVEAIKERRFKQRFTAKHSQFSRHWPESTDEPLEMRWGLLGVGVCPMPRNPRWRRPLRQNATNLFACLAACSGTRQCRSVAFSQHRGKCLLGSHVCDPDQLSLHTSYATFVPRELMEEAVPQTRVEVGEGSGEALRVFSFSTSRTGAMLKAYVSSMQMAGDRVSLLLRHASEAAQMSYAARNLNRHWPKEPSDFVEMQGRDRMKVDMFIRTVWDSLAAGVRSAVFSDIDVQVFPDWTRLVRACTLAAHLCILQQPGLYAERSYPFNVGFLAFGVDTISLEFALNLGARFEPSLLVTDPRALVVAYPLDQEVISEFVFQQGPWFWATFSPELVKIFVDVIPGEILRVKVQHACGARAGNRLASMYRTRRYYYSVLPLCPTGEHAGPQHPCCSLYGHQRSFFSPDNPRLPPFQPGSIYGLPRPDHMIHCIQEQDHAGLLGSTLEQAEYWKTTCTQERYWRMYEWELKYPQDDFMEGRATPLPEGFRG